jgi:hypothetical protein
MLALLILLSIWLLLVAVVVVALTKHLLVAVVVQVDYFKVLTTPLPQVLL